MDFNVKTMTAATKKLQKKTSRKATSVPEHVNKAVAAIHIRNDISCLQRKMWNVLLSNAYNDLPSLDIQLHEIQIKDLMEEVGFDSKNIAYLKQALEEMVTTKLTWNILDEKGEKEWGVSSALASAVISGGKCYYSYSGHLRQKLYNPEFYAPVHLGILRRFGSGHALSLYENCLRYRNIAQTPLFSIKVFRDLLGVGGNASYDDFKVLNRAVIKPAMAEVNAVSDICLDLQLKREKRKVVGIKFLIDQNRQESLPIASTENFNAVVLQKLQETFCLSEKQSKEVMVTNSEERIVAVMSYVESRYTAGKIQQGKIAPYFLKTLVRFDHSSAISSIDQKKAATKANKESEAARKYLQNKKLAEEAATRAALAESHWASLDAPTQGALLQEFEHRLIEDNQVLHRIYRKDGLNSKVVHTEFVKFVNTRITPCALSEET